MGAFVGAITTPLSKHNNEHMSRKKSLFGVFQGKREPIRNVLPLLPVMVGHFILHGFYADKAHMEKLFHGVEGTFIACHGKSIALL
jgi:hypothetical protein